MFKKNKSADPRKVDTLIGKETSMSGSINAKGTIRVDGGFEGDIVTQSDVIIGGNATVKAHVKGKNVTLAGKLEGDVDVENKLEILTSGALLGDIKTGILSVEEGGYFTGLCNMTGNGKKEFSSTINEQEGQEETIFQDVKKHEETKELKNTKAENIKIEEEKGKNSKSTRQPGKKEQKNKGG